MNELEEVNTIPRRKNKISHCNTDCVLLHFINYTANN